MQTLARISVGTEVSVRHLAPTLLDSTVEITVTVTAVEGRGVRFEVSAKDELDQICAGMHARFVVDKAKTFEAAESQGGEARRARLKLSAL